MVVLKCCGNELTKRVLSTLSPVLAQCGLNLPKVSKSKIKAKQLVLSNATERSDLSITTARATQFALQTTHHTQNLKGKTFQLPRSCSASQLEQITSTQDPSTTQKLRSNFFVAATEIWAATRSNTSNQPYTLSF